MALSLLRIKSRNTEMSTEPWKCFTSFTNGLSLVCPQNLMECILSVGEREEMPPAPDDMPTCGDWAPSGLNGRVRENRRWQRPGREAAQPEKESSQGSIKGIEEKNEVYEKFL